MEDPTEEPPRWSRSAHLDFPESGVYILPYYAPEPVLLNLSATMDGGTWRGLRLDFVGQDGVAVAATPGEQAVAARDWFEFRERARQVHEDQQRGVYEIECLGEREGDVCLPYDNPSQLHWRAEPWDDLALYTGLLPEGQNYMLIFAEFDSLFQANLTFSQPVWLGNILETAEGLVLSPELMRGELTDMVRCFVTGWCGSILDGRFIIDQGSREFALAFYYLSRGATVYGKSCFYGNQEEMFCGGDQPLGPTGKLFHMLRFSGKPPEDLEIRTTILGGSSTGWMWNRTYGHSFAMDGAVLWYDLPGQHPAETAGAMESRSTESQVAEPRADLRAAETEPPQRLALPRPSPSASRDQ